MLKTLRKYIVRPEVLYFAFLLLCFLLFILDHQHKPAFCGGPRMSSPQDILEKKIAFTALISIYISAFFSLLWLGLNVLKNRLPKIAIRGLKIAALTIPLLALFLCSFLFLGKSVLAEKHSSQESSPHNNIWCNPTCCNGINPTLDYLAGQTIDPLSYIRIYSLIYGTKDTFKFLDASADNAQGHGDDIRAESLSREQLQMANIEKISAKAKLHVLHRLSSTLAFQQRYHESLPYYRAAESIVVALLAQGTSPYDYYYHAVLEEAAYAEEQAGNIKESDKIREIIVESPVFSDMNESGKKGEYKNLPVETFNDMVSKVERSNNAGARTELLRIFSDTSPALPCNYIYPLCPDLSSNQICTLEKDKYQKLLRLAKAAGYTDGKRLFGVHPVGSDSDIHS